MPATATHERWAGKPARFPIILRFFFKKERLRFLNSWCTLPLEYTFPNSFLGSPTLFTEKRTVSSFLCCLIVNLKLLKMSAIQCPCWGIYGEISNYRENILYLWLSWDRIFQRTNKCKHELYIAFTKCIQVYSDDKEFAIQCAFCFLKKSSCSLT